MRFTDLQVGSRQDIIALKVEGFLYIIQSQGKRHAMGVRKQVQSLYKV